MARVDCASYVTDYPIEFIFRVKLWVFAIIWEYIFAQILMIFIFDVSVIFICRKHAKSLETNHQIVGKLVDPVSFFGIRHFFTIIEGQIKKILLFLISPEKFFISADFFDKTSNTALIFIVPCQFINRKKTAQRPMNIFVPLYVQ